MVEVSAPNQHSATKYDRSSAAIAGTNALVCSTQTHSGIASSDPHIGTKSARWAVLPSAGAPSPPRETSRSLSQPPSTVDSEAPTAMNRPFATAKLAARSG